MMLSMTGYGAAEYTDSGVSYALELKSLNHRYLKFSYKLPEPFQHCESAVEKVLRGRISRGSVSVSLRIRGALSESTGTLNLAAAQAYVNQLGKLRVPLWLRPTVDLGTIAALPGVAEAAINDDDAKTHQIQIAESMTAKALDALMDMRRIEGQALENDVRSICQGIHASLAEVEQLAPTVIDEYHERLRTRVNTLLQKGGFELEQEGLMREVAIYAEKCDIGEEIIRLKAHLDQVATLCEANEPIGRTFDFLTQELLREANTIASKSNHAGIAKAVVAIKGLIDRLKEQVQNVE